MPNVRRSRAAGQLRIWAGDSLGRQFTVRLVRTVVSLAVLAIGLAVILWLLVPNMIDGLTKQFRTH